MDVTKTLIAVFLGAFFLLALGRLFRKPLGVVLRLFLNTLLGFAALALVRLTAPATGIMLGINPFNAVLIGALGVPGFLLLVLSQWVLG